jgi:nicotinamidase-related amidase
MPLLDRNDSLLIVVDVQERFYGALRDDDAARLALVTERIAWLAAVATALGLPAVVTEEDPARNGPTVPAIRRALPADVPTFTKPVFGLADVSEIMTAVEATGRRTAVIAGLETDVCVAHSAIGLRDRGYRVAVVADSTFSPGEMHEHGLRRLAFAGVELVHAKGVYYEWLRTLDAVRALGSARPDLAEPPGFSL